MSDFDDPAERSSVGASARSDTGGPGQESGISSGFGTGLSLDVDFGLGDRPSIDELESRISDFESSVETSVGQRILDKLKQPETVGAIGGALLGSALGFGPAIGSKVGKEIGGFLGDQQAPSQQPGLEQSPGLARSPAAGLGSQIAQQTPQISAVGQFAPSVGLMGGQESQFVPNQIAQQVQPVARASGIAQSPGMAQSLIPLPGTQFLQSGGLIPRVNISAFPGSLGRIS